MTLAVKTATGTKSTSVFKVRTAAGLKTVQSGWIRTASGLKQFFSLLAVSVNRTIVAGSSSGGAVVTASVTASAVGGVAPYTYSWAKLTGNTDWSITSPTSATTTFGCSLASGNTESATFACTVTDATGASSVGPTVTARARIVTFGGTGGTL